MDAKNFDCILTNLCCQLYSWRDRFDQIADLDQLRAAFAEKVARFEAESQQLNIAIMGQVKAGKSSFLNALLFEGRPVLPTAATPKTANLTRISHAETPALEVEYYQPEEWQQLRQLARQTGDTDHIKVARELVDMVRLPESEIDCLLAAGVQRIEAASLDELMGQLNAYAGNDGAYTGLVKMTRLYLPIPELKGFDIIDTPGMNDPILSRTQKTKEEMARCDVVFFLSRSGQFLDKTDMHLLASQLPQSGVKRMVLVAAQYDDAIESDSAHRESLAETEANVCKRINKRAHVELGKLAEDRRQAGRVENAELLEQLIQPILSSTFAHGFVHWPVERWSKAMQHTHQLLMEAAQDYWNGYQWTPADFERIANFGQLTAAYQQARDDKQALLQQQREGILPEARQALTDTLESLHQQVSQRINTLKSTSLAELEKQQTLCEQQIQGMSSRLQEVISQQVSLMQQKQAEARAELKAAMRPYEQLRSRTGTETHSESYTVSTSTWYKPWTWGDTETRYRTFSVNYEYLSASDAVEQLSRYARDCSHDLKNHFNQLVSPSQLKLNLRRTLLDALQTHGTDFDPAQFRNTLEQAINRLQLPTLQLDTGSSAQQISRNFSGEVRGSSEKERLQQQFGQALLGVFEQLSASFERAVRASVEQLQQVRTGLQAELTASVRQELEALKADFAQQQQTLQDYHRLLQVVEQGRAMC